MMPVPPSSFLASELETFFLSSKDLLAVLDDELRVILFNPAFGRATDVAYGDAILSACDEKERSLVVGALQRSLATQSPEAFKAHLRTAEGLKAYEWATSVQPGRARLFLSLRDISLRERLERELAQAQKLEAVGSLASGIAHEINTPIQFIGDNLTFISDSLHDVLRLLNALEGHAPSQPLLAQFKSIDLPFLREELPAAVAQACEGVQRVAELVRGMKEFSHHDGGQVAPTDINQALERTITIARNEWKYVAHLETDLQPLPSVPCQGGAIRQVFLNLICNAAQTIAEQNTKLGRAQGLIKVTTRDEGAFVRISVSDDGTGIPESVKSRLFEPFFTTKPVGKGTGQGLAISRAIVIEKHRGRLEFDTKLGEGTTFHVLLPTRLDEKALAA